MNLRITVVGITILLMTATGCAANGPLIKPSFDSRREYVSHHPELIQRIKQAILEGRIVEGMTKEQVTVSWGKPSKMDDFGTAPDAWWYDPGGEGWWYKPFPISLEPTRFVKFKNGKVDYTSKDYK